MILHTHVERVSDTVSGSSRTCRRVVGRATGFGGFGRPADDRGESEVIAVVLLVGVVVVAAGLLVVYGVAAVDSRQAVVADTQAENAFEQFDARASRVALGGESAQQVDFGLADNEGHLYSDDEGWLRVVVTPEDGTPVEVTNTTLGTVYYKRDDTVVASQGGGVWRADGDGVVMLSRPEFHYTDQTLTLPIVSVDGDPGLPDRVQVTKDGPADREFPDPANGLTNKIRSGTVTVTVHSTFYEAWGRYFEENVGGLVTYDDASERVTVTFFGLPDVQSYDVGIIATSDTGTLCVAGTGAYVDSYDSSVGPYSVTASPNGSIRTAGNVTMAGGAVIDGDVQAGGAVDLSGGGGGPVAGCNGPGGTPQINGDVAWTAGTQPDPTKISGDVRRIDGIPSVPPIDTFVAAYAAQVAQDNDNDATPFITAGNELSLTGSTGELGAGDYYVNRIDLATPSNKQTLVLNTTEGNIRIVVRDWVHLRNADITVVGNGSVQVVVESQTTFTTPVTGAGSSQVHMHVGQDANVSTPGQRADRLVLFGPSDFAATIAGSNAGGGANNGKFAGVVFAPAGTTGSGFVFVKQADVYGLVMTGNLTAGQNGAVHYDRGIQNSLTDSSPLAELDYLHVAVHRVRVERG